MAAIGPAQAVELANPAKVNNTGCDDYHAALLTARCGLIRLVDVLG